MAAGDLAQRLLSGERIIWTGRPAAGLRLCGRDVLLVPFGLMFGGFAVFWETTVWQSPNAPVLFQLWGVPFVLVGAYLAVGRLFVDAWVRSATQYALTDRRVLIERSGPFKAFTSLNLDLLPQVHLQEHAGRRGTIIFGQPAPYWAQRNSWSYYTPALDPTPQFIAIEDARGVFNQIQRAIHGAA